MVMEMSKLVLDREYKLKEDTPLFRKGEKVMHIIIRETKKAWGISRGIEINKQVRIFQKGDKFEHKGFIFRREPTFWLPKSIVKKEGDVLILPDWLAKKIGLDLLEECD